MDRKGRFMIGLRKKLVVYALTFAILATLFPLYTFASEESDVTGELEADGISEIVSAIAAEKLEETTGIAEASDEYLYVENMDVGETPEFEAPSALDDDYFGDEEVEVSVETETDELGETISEIEFGDLGGEAVENVEEPESSGTFEHMETHDSDEEFVIEDADELGDELELEEESKQDAIKSEDVIDIEDTLEQADILNVLIPYALDFTIDPFELAGKGPIYSDTFVIENFGETDVIITLTNINVKFANDTDFMPLSTPFYSNTGLYERLKAIYLLLSFGRSDVLPVVATAGSHEEMPSILLHAQESGLLSSCSLSISGSINPHPASNWGSGDVSIIVTYRIETISEYETANTTAGENSADTENEQSDASNEQEGIQLEQSLSPPHPTDGAYAARDSGISDTMIPDESILATPSSLQSTVG